MSDLSPAQIVSVLVDKAREAQAHVATYNQQQIDQLVTAVGWVVMDGNTNRRLCEYAVQETGLGNVADKMKKNTRKTLGLMRDILGVKTVGVINDDQAAGIMEIARPVGVVGAIVPSTNPIATPLNNIINALKCANAIILAPSPKGQASCQRVLDLIHAELDLIGAPKDLVQMLPAPVSKALSFEMLAQVDLVVATGSQNNVRAAYTSGTPAYGVGAGNVTSIVDETADIDHSAAKIIASKTFDNATSCSSENSLIVIDANYEAVMASLTAHGACMLEQDEQAQLQDVHWQHGKLNPVVLAKPVAEVCAAAGIERQQAVNAKVLMVQETGWGKEHPFSGEKMSLVLTVYRARDFDHAKQLASGILSYQGAGHSLSLHTQDMSRAQQLGHEMPVCRVIVNQAHCYATGGSFDNSLPFSLSMGCGTWGGNITDQNVHFRHYMNVTRVVRPIPAQEVTAEDIFGDYQREFHS
ncbi:MAG: aldehyde dehydrogenase family protein [Gammaproteobacteria bacterium]|nr:aldehyde dehydrogenase family protein [Gammaproteobacteria bacterium]MDP6166669.1 aldehyde dehydrogenase family protein [Gammaproteobacteria bacterium]